MQIDFSRELKALNGDTFPLTPTQGMRLKDAVAEAILNPTPDRKEILGNVKHMERYSLAKRVYDAMEPVELTIEELAEIRRLVSERWPTVIAGPALYMLG